MRVFQLARIPPRWLRACLVSLVLVLALDSMGHVLHTHGHEFDGRPGVETALCSFCVAFDRMADGPATTAFVVAPADLVAHPLQPEPAVPAIRPVFRFVPRGPPAA